MIYTTSEAAEALSLAPRTVRKWCAELGIRKAGRDYLIDELGMRKIRAAAQDRPGRPASRTEKRRY